MGAYTKEDRLAALKFATKVAELAKTAPDPYSKRCTYQVVHAIRRKFGFKDDDKAEIVMHWLTQGCSKYDELVSESGFDRGDVVRAVQHLQSLNRVKILSLSVSETGRPAAFIQVLRPAADFSDPKN